MTRIYTLGLITENEKGGSYLLVQVAHRHCKGATRAALAHAAKESTQRWRVVHKAERRTGLAIPQGEILGATGPFTYEETEA